MPAPHPDVPANPAASVTAVADLGAATRRRIARNPQRRWWLAALLGLAGLGLGGGPAAAAQDAVAVLPAPSLAAALRAPLTQAVSQALGAAHVALLSAAELESALGGDPGLRGCATPTCLERLGRLLGARAVVGFSATAQSPGAKATYQLQVDYFQVEVGAQSASLTSTCASCTTAEAAQSLRELTRQVVAADAARRRGVLAVESTPPSATVLVDGNDSGRTPYERPALVGTHSIVLQAPGYLSQQANISVAEARTSRLDILLLAGRDGVASPGPDSGATPVYKKAWFWVVVGGAAVAVAAVTTGVVLSQNRGPAEPAHALNHIAF